MKFLIAFLLLATVNAYAEIVSITVVAKVKSFDAKTVNVVVNEQTVILPRDIMPKVNLASDMIVPIILYGQNIELLGFKRNALEIVDSAR
jgi:hypothetical protein